MKKTLRNALTISALVSVIAAFGIPARAAAPFMGTGETGRQAALQERAKVNRDMSKMHATLVLGPFAQVQKTYQTDYVLGLLDFNSGHYNQATRNLRAADKTLRKMPEWQDLK